MKKKQSTIKTRCKWANENDLLMHYHDEEWGVPVYNDKKHFEMLILEGAQAGLNWLTVLKKRQNYKRRFKNFNPQKIAMMSDKELNDCLNDEGVIRNKLKIYSVRKNAMAFLKIQEEFGSFDKYIRMFMTEKKRRVARATTEVITQTEESIQISKDLKKRGMSFVGPTIIYAFMQAIGLVNDHEKKCWRYHA